MLKGISPILAAVLLIAFVVGLGLLASPWFTEFFKTRGAEVEKRAELDCTFLSLDAEIKYDIAGENDSVNITLDNIGSEDAYDFKIVLVVDGFSYTYDPTEETKITSQEPLPPGGRATLITNITQNLNGTPESVKIIPGNCPQQYVLCDIEKDICA